MPVFDINAGYNQHQYSSILDDQNVESGIALRAAQQASLEKSTSLADKGIELEERRVKIQEAEQQRLQEQWNEVKDSKEGKILTEGFTVAHAAYQNAIESGRSEEEASAFAYDNMIDKIDMLLPGQREAAEKSANENGITRDTFDIVSIVSQLGIMPTAGEPFTLAEGAQRYAPDGTLLAENEKDFSPTPMVSINSEGEDAATKAYGGTVGKRAGDRDDKALATYDEDTNLSRLELALSRGARSGFGEDVILDVRGALDTLGLAQFPEGAQESEVVRSIGNVLALRMRNPDSGLGLTGNTSNKDLTFLKDSVAGIGRSEGGNLLLVKMAKSLNQFKRDIASEQARIIQASGGKLPLDLDKQLMDYANKYEMFTKTEREEIGSFVSGKNSKPATVSDASDEDILKALERR